MKINVNAHDTYEPWRDGEHDDLVLATALACWAGERFTIAKPSGGKVSSYVTWGSRR